MMQFNKMSVSFENENYSIVSSLNERTIYIKIIDKITYMCYESNLDSKELRLSIELGDTYKLINKCFNKDSGYSVMMTTNTGVMKLVFVAMVEGFLKISFEVLLREKVMSNDGQLTMNFNRIEQKQAQAIQVMTERLNQLEGLMNAIAYAEIYMLLQPYTSQHNGNKIYWNLNSKELNLVSNYWDYSKIAHFYQLEKLSFISCGDMSGFNNLNVSNKSVREIIMNTIHSSTLLDGLSRFPKLEKLSCLSCQNLANIVIVLSSYKHTITDISIKSCGQVNNTEIMTYCQKNNIKLDLA
jgi:hypothetical protein